MPQKDRSFSATDVLRIVDKHLTPVERDEVILVLCELFEESDILRLLYILRDGIEAINDIIEPVRKWFTRFAWLRPVLIVLEITEVILNTTILLIEFFEALSRS